MNRSGQWSLVLGAVLAMAASACDVHVDVGDGGTATGGGTGGSSGSGGGTPSYVTCSTSAPCPSGEFCFNGLCALGCQTNGNCASDQYCDTEFDHLCHNKTVATCARQGDCASTQVCIEGLCSTPPPTTQCDPDQVSSGNDGCDSHAVCIDPAETDAKDPRCYTFPACAEDKTCPIGLQGAVCNDGLIPNKAHICLTGLCRSEANCPSSWVCVKFTATDVLGICSNRGTGEPCTSASQCLSGNCSIIAPGFPGICL